MVTRNNFTTIGVSKKTLSRLQKFKYHNKETSLEAMLIALMDDCKVKYKIKRRRKK